MLKSPAAEKNYGAIEKAAVAANFPMMTKEEKDRVLNNARLGLPGSEEAFTPAHFLTALKTYESIETVKLKKY
jgi:mannonate dehydratase